MPLVLAQRSGYCAGVRRAMNMAYAAACRSRAMQVPCSSLGAPIHNRFAVAKLEEEGVRIVRSPEEIASGCVILRSHGVSKAVMDECLSRGLEVVDCTCSFVRSIHEIVREKSLAGMPVILIGDSSHPEVLGTAGWCEGECLIVSSVEQARALKELPGALVVAQTTFSPGKWREIVDVILESIPNADIRDTLCPATEERQKEARQMARTADAMVVIGDRTSANTRELFEACVSLCPRTCLVERAADIPPRFGDIQREIIGVTAGASTPDWLLKEVVTRMNDMEQEFGQEVVNEPVTDAPVAEETTVTETVAEVPVAAEEAEVSAPAEPMTEEEKRQKRFMDDIEKSMVRIRPGQTIAGTVVQLTDDEVCVNIGYKSDGLIKRSELVDTDVKLGDTIDVEVVKVNDGEGNVILSQRNIVNRKVWEELMEKNEKGEYIDAVGKEAIKGGLIADANGVRAFIPASQLAQRYVEKIGQFVGQPMKLKIIDVNQQKKSIVCSRKEVLAVENAAKKAAAWEKLEEGAIVEGIVRRFADFGAFVDLGGVDGLIHVTDIAWSRINHPSEVLAVNQPVQVKILSLDRERERIQLGYKQLQPKPWDNIEEKYPVGTILERNVVRIRPFGAFIELEPGVDGLVHISQCALTRIEKVEDALTVGQPVRVKVLAVDPEAKRISLSVREALADDAYTPDDDMQIPGDDEMTDAPEAEAEEAMVEEVVVEEAPVQDTPAETPAE